MTTTRPARLTASAGGSGALPRRTVVSAGAATAVGLALAACGSKDAGGDTAGGDGKTVTVVTHDTFSVPDDLVSAFQNDTGCALELVASGDAGELTNKLVMTKDAPLGDAFFGVDSFFASRLLEEDVLDTSAAVALPAGADQYVLSDTPALTPIDFGEVAVNVDTAWFAEHGAAPPAAFEDLTEPEYKDLLVAINPSTSSVGLAFLVATVNHFGTAETGGFADYWKQLAANGVTIDSDWSNAYYTDFSGGGEGGVHPIVVSYSSSPAATVTADGSATTTASLPTTAIRQVEYAGVLAGAANPEGAKMFLTWLLSTAVQSTFSENMYVYPINPDATVSESMTTFGAASNSPIIADAAEVSANREAWLAAWTQAVGA